LPEKRRLFRRYFWLADCTDKADFMIFCQDHFPLNPLTLLSLSRSAAKEGKNRKADVEGGARIPSHNVESSLRLSKKTNSLHTCHLRPPAAAMTCKEIFFSYLLAAFLLESQEDA
jgi:hypothetical protein